MNSHLLKGKEQNEDCFHEAAKGQGTDRPGVEGRILEKLTKIINDQHKPPAFAPLDLYEVVSFSLIAGQQMMHKIQAIYSQTGKHTAAPRLICSCVAVTMEWRVSIEFTGIKCLVRDCLERARSRLHNQTSPVSIDNKAQLKVVELTNVDNCVELYYRPVVGARMLGISLCKDPVHQLLHVGLEERLPNGVFLICGDTAFASVPQTAEGLCYLAHLIPMIRKVSHEEIKTLHRQVNYRQRRALTMTQRVFGILIPAYGVYNSQEELRALICSPVTYERI